MRVYRVEHPQTGMGPFFCATDSDLTKGLHRFKHKEYERMPPPCFDKLPVGSSNHVFAFPSLSIYQDFWDRTTLECLKAKGYILKVYDVADKRIKIGKSGLQCCYNSWWAKPQFDLDLLAALDV